MGWVGRDLKDHGIPAQCDIPVTFPGREQSASGAGGLVRKSWIRFYLEYPTVDVCTLRGKIQWNSQSKWKLRVDLIKKCQVCGRF